MINISSGTNKRSHLQQDNQRRVQSRRKTSCRGKTGGRIRGQQNDGEQGAYGIGK